MKNGIDYSNQITMIIMMVITMFLVLKMTKFWKMERKKVSLSKGGKNALKLVKFEMPKR